MATKKLQDFLSEHHVRFMNIKHSPSYTAQEIAASAHIPGNEMAKTVIVKVDGKLAMVVLTANGKINFRDLEKILHSGKVELASEREFQDKFPGCELGAMPPFGNLYGMDVYVDKSLSEDKEIAFNAGSHSELIKMAFTDFDNLVHPKVLEVRL